MKFFYSLLLITLVAGSLSAATNAETTARQARTLLILSKDPVDFFVEAMGTRNTEAMYSFAKEIRASDSQTAEKMLECSALFAALQQKKELFQKICEDYPQGKKYQSFLLGKKQPSLLPQIVKIKKIEEINTLSSDYLASWESSFFTAFEDASEEKFADIANQVNDARWNLDAEKMANASEKIAKLKIKKDSPEQLSAAAVLQEAMFFAELSKNSEAFSKCIEIGKTNNLLQKNELKEAELTLKSLASTRGQQVRVNTTRDVQGRSVYRNGVRHTQLQIGDDTQVEIVDDSEQSSSSSSSSSNDDNFIVALIKLPFQLSWIIIKLPFDILGAIFS